MSNATDCLLVGGPKGGTVWCLNRNAPGFPRPIGYALADMTTLTYVPRPWWDDSGQEWYWIATSSEYPVDDSAIALEIIVADFNPAWDLRSKPAPILEQDDE